MKKLHRTPQKGIVAGVVAGIAEYFAVDVTVLRLLCIVFLLVTGFFPGVVLYILAVLIMPVESPVIHEPTEPKSAAE